MTLLGEIDESSTVLLHCNSFKYLVIDMVTLIIKSDNPTASCPILVPVKGSTLASASANGVQTRDPGGSYAKFIPGQAAIGKRAVEHGVTAATMYQPIYEKHVRRS